MSSVSSKRLYRHISGSVCPWNAKLSQALVCGSPLAPREFISGRDAVPLAREIRAFDENAFSGTFRLTPVKEASRGPRYGVGDTRQISPASVAK